MDLFRVEATSRSEVGKGEARKLRRSGKVPGVAYGLHRDPQPIVVSEDVVRRLMRLGHSVLVDLTVDDQPRTEGVAAIVKALDHHPISWAPRSIDFQWVSLTETVEVPVPIVTVGEARGAEQEDGVVEQILHEVPVKCLPTNIPERLEMDITELTIGASLHVRDLVLPEGVEVVADPDDPVVTCAAPRIVEEEAEIGEEVAGELEEREGGTESEDSGER